MASTLKARKVEEKLWGFKCKCGYTIELDLDYTHPSSSGPSPT